MCDVLRSHQMALLCCGRLHVWLIDLHSCCAAQRHQELVYKLDVKYLSHSANTNDGTILGLDCRALQ